MKKFIIAASLLAFASSSFAQDVKTTAPVATAAKANDDNSKTKVEPAALPEAVKKTLDGEQYKGWTIAGAWAVNAEPAYYSIELKQGDKTNTVNIDKEGKVK